MISVLLIGGEANGRRFTWNEHRPYAIIVTRKDPTDDSTETKEYYKIESFDCEKQQKIFIGVAEKMSIRSAIDLLIRAYEKNPDATITDREKSENLSDAFYRRYGVRID